MALVIMICATKEDQDWTNFCISMAFVITIKVLKILDSLHGSKVFMLNMVNSFLMFLEVQNIEWSLFPIIK